MSDAPAPFAEVYRRHAPGVFRRARRLLGSDADAHEVVQDLFLSFLETPEQFQGKSALTTFLYAATTNACLNRIRNQKNRMRLVSENANDPGEALSPSPEQLAYLHRLLRDMPDPLGQVAVHYYVDDLNHEDIARILGCSRRHVGDLVLRVTEWARAQEAKPC
jgi:RNA polymerase sigma-70 factor (ECF subfamily)